MGDAYFDTDRYQEAIDAYSKALAIDPKNPDVRTDLGIMYRKLGQFDKALETFRRAAQDNPTHINSRFNLGVVLKYDKEDFQGAIQAWEDFLKVVPPDDERVTMVKKEIQDMKATFPKNRKRQIFHGRKRCLKKVLLGESVCYCLFPFCSTGFFTGRQDWGSGHQYFQNSDTAPAGDRNQIFGEEGESDP